MLITKFSTVESKYWLRFHVSLKTAQVKPMHIGKGIEDADRGLNLHTPTTSLILFFKTQEERDSWNQAINQCITDLTTRRNVIQQLKQEKLIFE